MSNHNSYIHFRESLVSSPRKIDKAIGSMLLLPMEAMQLYKLLQIADTVLVEKKVEYFAWAGTLLGSVRHGGLIPWDDDVDIIIHDSQVERFLSKDVISSFNSHNTNVLHEKHKTGSIYHLYLEENPVHLKDTPILVSSSQLFQKNPTQFNNGRPFYESKTCIDIFVFKTNSENPLIWEPIFQKYKGKDCIHVNDVYPVKRSLFGSFTVNTFAKSESYLQQMYGPNCLTETFISQCHSVRNSSNVMTILRYPRLKFVEEFNQDLCSLKVPCIDINHYWTDYYSWKAGHVPSSPSSFAQFVAQYLSLGSTSQDPQKQCTQSLIDVGCGTGRDSKFFASLPSLHVLGVDPAKYTEKDNTTPSITFTREVKGCLEIKKQFGQFDIVYMRFFLHAIDSHTQKSLLHDIEKYTKPGAFLCIEARSLQDEMHSQGIKLSDTESFTDHYRRFASYPHLLEDIREKGFDIKYSVHEKGLAKFADQDPHVIRIIGQKKAHVGNGL